MRCRFCGAEVKEGNRVCEYCGSAVEKETSGARTIIRDSGKPHGSIAKVICKSIIILACIWAAVIITSLIVVLNSDVLKDHYEYMADTDAAYGLPRNERELTGKVISCDNKGVALIEYEGSSYENVKILDEALITWLHDTNRTLDTVGICFTTDENGDISELGLLSSGFFIVAEEEGRYIAIRDGNVISFTSKTPLETECYYGGYFSYPDIRLYSAEEESLMNMSYMDPKCENKESTLMQEYYTGEEIAVYKILVKGQWYYCSKETYDAVGIDDLLNEYQMYTDDGFAFLVKD